MDRDSLLERITARMTGEPLLAALFLGGSLGSGGGDRFSDIDLVALPAGDAPPLADAWPAILSELAEVVFHRRSGQGNRFLFNAVTADWLRCDLHLTEREDVLARPRSALKPLVDPERIHSALPDTVPARGPDAARLSWMIGEFLRILGLLPVALGRGEFVTAVQGAGFQRDALVQLMKLDAGVPPDGGLLHLSRVLPSGDMATLAALPAATVDRGTLFAAHRATAEAFLPRARRMATAAGVPWPAAFEEATRRHLRTTLDFEFPPSAAD